MTQRALRSCAWAGLVATPAMAANPAKAAMTRAMCFIACLPLSDRRPLMPDTLATGTRAATKAAPLPTSVAEHRRRRRFVVAGHDEEAGHGQGRHRPRRHGA